MAFRYNLRELRKRKGVSLETAADEIGITHRHLRRLEQGKAWAPVVDVLEDIAQYYDAPVEIVVVDGRRPA